MSYNSKNYTKQGGAETHFGGKLVIDAGCVLEGFPDAGAETKGFVQQGVAVADAAGEAPTAAEFKALLDSLRGAGIIATAEADDDDADDNAE